MIPSTLFTDASHLLNADVQSHYWHDEYYFQTFTGRVLDAKTGCFGPVVLFMPDAHQRDLTYTLSPRWLPLSYVTGFAHIEETQKTAS